ncbi:hypothetical protein AVEN_245581-1 [Araneus ventricosus]|uniref:Uncharacterized protein n=1 Tax=Araneus ventricosus TaxID=182803 RepID=A0A4Y2H2T4_ARAVE|nr:hypothetical protein AVEN_245581-1 [Araneus ventricosus]
MFRKPLPQGLRRKAFYELPHRQGAYISVGGGKTSPEILAAIFALLVRCSSPSPSRLTGDVVLRKILEDERRYPPLVRTSQ